MPTSVIFTSYLTSKPHPQATDPSTIGLNANGYVEPDSYEYIRGYYESVKPLGVETLIFHDGLADVFINMYATEHIRFVKVTPTSDVARLSLNDARFIYYREYLQRHSRTLPDMLFMTDICDVRVKKDPGELSPDHFYCGDEDGKTLGDYVSSFGGGGFFDVCKRYNWFPLLDPAAPLLNMGVLGGRTLDVFHFLSRFYVERMGIEESVNLNMPLGVRLVYEMFSDKLKHGEPFNSRFKKFELHRSDVYFVHK
jgi:hypothetical protein